MINKITLPEENYNVPDYDEEQSIKINEIIDEVNDTSSKLKDLLVKFGLIADYVIETGKNANGSWEKWHSGKLVQRGIYVISNINTDYTASLPIAFVDSNASDIWINGNIVRTGGFNNFYSVLKGIGSNKQSFIVRAEMTTGTTTMFPFHWKSIGRWKA